LKGVTIAVINRPNGAGVAEDIRKPYFKLRRYAT
jgi:hypothetical protein